MNQTYRLIEFEKHIQPVVDDETAETAQSTIAHLDDICRKHGGVAYNARPAELRSWSDSPEVKTEAFLRDNYLVTSSHLIGTYLVTSGVNTALWVARTQIVPLNCEQRPELIKDFEEFYQKGPKITELKRDEEEALEEAV